MIKNFEREKKKISGVFGSKQSPMWSIDVPHSGFQVVSRIGLI